MAERKHFQSQKLDKEDYSAAEAGAKVVKDGGKIILVGGLMLTVVKKYGPEVVKQLRRLRKL